MFDPKRLLQYEFFPAELPPCFNSDDLAANAQHAIQAASKLNRACWWTMKKVLSP